MKSMYCKACRARMNINAYYKRRSIKDGQMVVPASCTGCHMELTLTYNKSQWITMCNNIGKPSMIPPAWNQNGADIELVWSR